MLSQTLVPATTTPELDGFVTEDAVPDDDSITARTSNRITDGIAAVLSSLGMEDYADDPDIMDTLTAMVMGGEEGNDASSSPTALLDNMSDMLALLGGGGDEGNISSPGSSSSSSSALMENLPSMVTVMDGDTGSGSGSGHGDEYNGHNDAESVVRCNNALQAMVRQGCDESNESNAECAQMRSICGGGGKTSVAQEDEDDLEERTCTLLGIDVMLCEEPSTEWNPNSVQGLYCGLVSQACQLFGSP